MKKSFRIILSTLLMVCIMGCGADNSRREAAAALVEQARSLTEAHQYDSALVVLDTLNIKYRDCLDERREGTLVRLSALSSLTRDSLAAAELQLRSVTTEIDSLAPHFRKVEVEGTEGYYVNMGIYSGSEMNNTGIQARIDDQGYCFIVANVEGRRIGLNSIGFGDISTPAINSIEVEGSEIMSITQEAAADLLNALSQGKGVAKIVLNGVKGKVDVTISPKQREAIVATWHYAIALQQQRALNIRLEKLERQLARLSDQLASQIPLPEED